MDATELDLSGSDLDNVSSVDRPYGLGGQLWTCSVANCRCDVSAFDLRKSMWRNSKIDVATFEDRSKIDDRCHDVSIFEDRCVDLRRSMC